MTADPNFAIVVAATQSRGIGYKGSLPWKLPGETAHFKKLTTQTVDPTKQNCVIMGRKTWFSISERFRPLPNRRNIVITSNPHFKEQNNISDSVLIAENLSDALHKAQHPEIENIFVIGGAQVYADALQHPNCKRIYYTKILKPEFVCDTFFPVINEKFFHVVQQSEIQREGDVEYVFMIYERVFSS